MIGSFRRRRSKIFFLRVHQKWSRSIPMFCDWRLSLRMATITKWARPRPSGTSSSSMSTISVAMSTILPMTINSSTPFPTAFRKAYVYGAEAKLTLSPVHRFSGFVSYSYQVGSVYLPVTGGLFLGSDATNALTNTNGRLWDSQDQRHTLHARVRYQLVNRVWIAFGGQYGSGLPMQ